MKKIFSVCMVLFLMQMGAAQASCYSMAEAEAEQGIRIHSELMVIGLNCQHMTPPGEANYYAQYRSFTSKYQSLFQDYEGRLINYYKRVGHANPQRGLDDLRTQFANKISQNVAELRPDVFCKRYIERIHKAGKMNQGHIKKWATTFYDTHPVSRPMCAN